MHNRKKTNKKNKTTAVRIKCEKIEPCTHSVNNYNVLKGFFRFEWQSQKAECIFILMLLGFFFKFVQIMTWPIKRKVTIIISFSFPFQCFYILSVDFSNEYKTKWKIRN